MRLDWPVFAFAAGVMLFIGVGFGLLPAWRASRTDLRSALGSIGRGSTLDGGTRRLLGGLIVVEIAIAALLLLGSLTLTQYFRKIVHEPWGFSTNHRIVFNAMLSDRLFDSPDARARTIDQTLTELRALPGVRSVSVTAPAPMDASWDLMSCVPEGSQPPEPRGTYAAYMRGTSPGYFATIGQRLLRGRDFAETDRADAPPVCIVNESFARRFWPGQDPLGKRVKHGRLDNPRPWYTVVGIVADTKSIADPRDGEVVGTVALPLSRWLANGGDEMTFVMESAGEAKVSRGISAPRARSRRQSTRGLQAHFARRGRGGIVGDGTFSFRSRFALRRARTRARVDRSLRVARASGDAAHARIWNSPRARRDRAAL